MALAYEKVANLAVQFSVSDVDPRVASSTPNEKILLRFLIERKRTVKPKEIAKMFKVKPITITKWSKTWLDKGLIYEVSGNQRIMVYEVGQKYEDLTLTDSGYR